MLPNDKSVYPPLSRMIVLNACAQLNHQNVSSVFVLLCWVFGDIPHTMDTESEQIMLLLELIDTEQQFPSYHPTLVD